MNVALIIHWSNAYSGSQITRLVYYVRQETCIQRVRVFQRPDARSMDLSSVARAEDCRAIVARRMGKKSTLVSHLLYEILDTGHRAAEHGLDAIIVVSDNPRVPIVARWVTALGVRTVCVTPGGDVSEGGIPLDRFREQGALRCIERLRPGNRRAPLAYGQCIEPPVPERPTAALFVDGDNLSRRLVQGIPMPTGCDVRIQEAYCRAPDAPARHRWARAGFDCHACQEEGVTTTDERIYHAALTFAAAHERPVIQIASSDFDFEVVVQRLRARGIECARISREQARRFQPRAMSG